ncbi:MAG TPA: bifunctional demethylmenaquinone methyltransferase/2-methoxy-6-polyprenyl-1,4-benzoquinol methylase UbiE [Bacteroidetes bacterium]|jgi:demethylmenaquinone methyltransferase/2-methoxy-6-polyprenyl-1,4-benzoquinol methylase|nr:bifunctional demethylmenaquinone methyltransferase/2-methoxy-6-polyprenyl-1,4-benzoquinol methylase UbiE [Bacteroidota bacterium]
MLMNSSTSDKEGNIKKMFDSIAFRYDFLNHLTSFGVDKIWRKKAMGMISSRIPGSVILDVATGTADLAIEASKYNPSSIKGIDVSDKMLEIGRFKLLKKGVQDKIELFLAASEDIPFETNSFDIVISAFGVRNFDDLERGLLEMNRVLKIGGKVLILEFSKPSVPVLSHIYRFYFIKILPLVGRVVSKDKDAYSYLPRSVMEFPEGNDFLRVLTRTGYSDVAQKPLTFGIVSVYTGVKGN